MAVGFGIASAVLNTAKSPKATFYKKIEKIISEDGFVFAIKKEPLSVSVTIHAGETIREDDLLGAYDVGTVEIDCQQKLEIGGILDYLGESYAILRSLNEFVQEGAGKAAAYKYIGQSTSDAVKRFFILDENQIQKNLTTSVYSKMSEAKIFSLPLLPAMFRKNLTEPCIVFDSLETETNGLSYMQEDGKIWQNRTEKCELNFINTNVKTALNELKKLQNALDSDSVVFGLVGQVGVLRDVTEYVSGFDIKLVSYRSEWNFNHSVCVNETESPHLLKQIGINLTTMINNKIKELKIDTKYF